MQSPSGRVGLTTPAGRAASSSTALVPMGSLEKSTITSARSPGPMRTLRMVCGESSSPNSTPIWVIGTTLLSTRL